MAYRVPIPARATPDRRSGLTAEVAQGAVSHSQEMERGEVEHERGMQSQTQAEQAAEKQAAMKPKAGEQ